jgi:hypothetical protein
MVVMDHRVNHVQDHNEIILLAKTKQKIKRLNSTEYIRVSFLDRQLIFDYKIYKQNPPFVAYVP